MYRKIILYLTILFAFSYTNIIRATVYYVDRTVGDDTYIGDEAHPWKSIQKAANTLVAGDTVYIKAGTYTPTQKIEFTNSGVSDSYINYLAYPGDEHLVIIDGVNVSLPNWYGVFSIVSKNYIKISGLKVINSSYAGFFVDSSTNILIENNHTYETQSSGISVWSSDWIVVDNNEVSRACWPTGGKQECISIVTSNRVIVKNNHVFDGGSIGYGGGGEGIDIKNGSTNCIVYNNIVNDVASVGIYVDAYAINQSNVQVLNNRVYNVHGVGIVAASEEGGALEDVIVTNNVVYNSEDRAMVIHWVNKPDYVIKNIYIQHNTFYNNGEGLDIGAHSLGENINIINNIFSQNSVYQIQNSSADFDSNQVQIKNNVIHGTNPAWGLFGENFSTLNPEFVDISTSNFQLQSTSPAIDQGTFLTNTTTSGAGNILDITSVGYFTNGYEIKEGDSIQIAGQTQPFEILDMDRINNTITLNGTASWNSGDGVSLPFKDDMPDIGAFEYDSSLITNSELIEDLLIYPNPINDIFYVSDKYLYSRYQIITTNGIIIQNGVINSNRINTAKMSSGIYILRIFNEGSRNINVSKLIKE